MAPYFLSSLTIAIAVLAAFADGAVNIPLGSCANFAVEAGTAITFDGTVTTIATGNVGVSPGTSIGGNAILGTGSFESQSTLSIACASDLEIAYNAASAATPTIYLSLIPSGMTMTADLAGLSLTPGVYTSTGSISISASTVTLDGQGDMNAQFLFQASTDLLASTQTSFILINGAQATNVYWAIGSKVVLGQASSFVGTILAGTAIVFDTGSVLVGRALAHTAVSFAGHSTVTLPVGATSFAITSLASDSLPAPVLSVRDVSVKSSSKHLRSRTAVRTTSTLAAIDLLSCSSFAVHAGTAMSFNNDISLIASEGDIGVSPGTSITGNYMMSDGSVEVISAKANQCALDRVTAYNVAAAAVCPFMQSIDELSEVTLMPGVYCTSYGSMSLSYGTATLDAQGDSNGVWIFQTPTTLLTAPNTMFVLQNGAQAKNVFWQVGSSATLGYSSTFVGTILAYASISVDRDAIIDGRMLAGAAVTFAGTDAITLPTL